MKNEKKPAAKTYGDVSIKKLPGSQIEIAGSVPADIFDGHRAKALENINKTVNVDGFRHGNVPEKILATKVGEKTILEEMAELALGDAYPAIIIDHNLDPISRPEISITKMAPGNPLEFIIKTAVTPEVKLGDYKKIAAMVPPRPAQDAEVSDKEVDDALARIRAAHEKEHPHEQKHEHTKDDAQKNHDHAAFDTPEFKDKIKESLVSDKARMAREKRRIDMAEKIAEASGVELPAVLIQSELRRIEAQFTEDITRMGTTVNDYLAHAKKTIEDIRNEWKPHAERKVKLQLVLNKIADTEKIVVGSEEIEAEVKHILEHYKDANRERAALYAAGVLSNEKVFQFLENQKTS